MRRLYLVVLPVLLAVLATCAHSQVQSVRWDSDGTKGLTADGWTLAGTTGDGFTKSKDYSNGQSDPGTNGVWHINDNNSPVNAYMRMYKDPSGISSSQGMVMARVKCLGGGSVAGTFGYSSASGNHSVVLAVRPGQLNWKTGEGAPMIPAPVSVDTQSDYRVYALRYYSDGTFDAWYSLTNDWSPNQSDWVQVVTGGYPDTSQGAAASAFKDETGTAREGLLMGSFGSSGTAWEGNVDYIAWSSNSMELVPWSFNPRVLVSDDSTYVSDTIPTVMYPGEPYTVSVTLRNSGTNTWTPEGGYKLGAVDDSDPFTPYTLVDLDPGESVATNQQKTFTFQMIAPTEEGIYTTDWRMIHEGTGSFGYTLSKQVNVSSLPLHAAQVVSDTIPATMMVGQTCNVSVTMRNTGSLTWTPAEGIRLGAVDDSDPFFAPGRVDLSPADSIATGQQKTFNFTMTAPTTPGTYTTDWRMLQEFVTWFGDTLTKQVEVTMPEGGLLINDPLQGSTIGTRGGGTFVAEGWKVTGKEDFIYWHLPYTVSKGAVEFDIKGLYPNECRVGMEDKSEIFHMYDYTFGDSDNQYNGGYRDNPYKHFVRKNGCLSSYNNTIDAMEFVWKIGENYTEPDSQILSWDPATTYHFREEWGPDGAGNSVIRTYRNGALIMTMSLPGSYAPAGHSIRIAASTRRSIGPDMGAPIDGIYSNIKAWDLSGGAPFAPTVIWPVDGKTVNSRTPAIIWAGDTHTMYQVRVNTANDPETGIAWDSGQVTSSGNIATSGLLADQAEYYVFVKIGNADGWSGWSPAGHSFRVDTSYVDPRRGLVRVWGNCLEDDGGKFLGLGASYMSAMRHCKYNRDLFKSNLSLLSAGGFNYVRILSMVGWYSAWRGKEIAPVSFTGQDGAAVAAWSDYWQQFRDTVDIAYDQFGIRTQVTIFADAQLMPTDAQRMAHLDGILANIAGREHKIILLEICNEYWQNGFPDPTGIPDMRRYAEYLSTRTSIPIALSATAGGTNSLLTQMYQGSVADIATEHFSRDIGTSEGGWLPVRDCWRVEDAVGVPPVSSNEPIGPGSSVASENDPIKLVSAAVFAWIAKLPMYVYHTSAGVFAAVPFENMAAIGDYKHLTSILPSDLPNWTRNDGIQTSAPFTVFCNGQANKYWTDVAGATSGCHRNIGSIKDDQFVCYPQGILAGGVTLQARIKVTFSVYNPLTGAVVDTRTLNAGESFTLAQGPGAYIIKGTIDSPTAMVGVPSVMVTRTGPVSFSVTFSESVTGFDSAADIQINATGTAAAGSVGITGSGAGPYTVTLSGITGEGTLGITVKAGVCTGASGIPNKASAASSVVSVLASDGSVASAKLQGIDTPVSLGNKVLYLKQGIFGYIEEKDRYSGIRIEGVIGASEGDLVCLTGTMKATPAAEKYILIDKLSPAGTYDLKPLGVTNRWLCSSMMDGLYIRCWGRVAAGSVTANSFVLTDGSDPAGVKIVTQGAPGVSEGDFVMVTGAAGFDGSRVIYRK